ncbi:MAG: hypothetical protein ABJM43_14575 [Paracoccaceae bacterium]
MKIKISDCAELAKNSYGFSKAASKGTLPNGIIASLDRHGAQAVVTKDNLLLIPGSNELSDWFKNFDVIDLVGKRFRAKQASRSKSGAMFHAGFWLHTQQIHAFAKENNVRFIIGHSLGAAAAQILGVALNVPTVGFASPRVKKGKRPVRHEDKILNICRTDDLVTRVPPSEFGFRRLGKTYRLNPPSINKGMDHSMEHYEKALGFDALEGQLPKSWG